MRSVLLPFPTLEETSETSISGRAKPIQHFIRLTDIWNLAFSFIIFVIAEVNCLTILNKKTAN